MAQRSLGETSNQDTPDTDWKSFLNPSSGEPIGVFPKISLSSAEWKKKLPDLQYKILFEEHTEPRFSSPLNNEKRRGIYHDGRGSALDREGFLELLQDFQ